MFSSISSNVQTTTPSNISKSAVVVQTAPVGDGTTSKAEESAAEGSFVEKEVESYFKGTPALVSVAYCESRFRQTNSDGNIFRGVANNKDVGVMQVNESFHLEKSKSLGMDIYTLSGNMAYAKYLYDREGLAPWASSKACWLKYQLSNEIALNK